MHTVQYRLRIGLVVWLVLFANGWASANQPTQVEIAKRGKAATAFVEVPNRGSATAFCIHPSGLFLTNEHVVRGAEKSEITLVLDSSLKTQKILTAKLLRVDQDLDLALLRVEVEGELPALELGSIDGVSELMEVVAFGFPFGRQLSPDHKDYPSISVNSGKITALRFKEGQLQQIQIDVALAPGNSGGPVLDDQGRVIGVVESGVRGTQGINQAIPASQVQRFLKTPEILFKAPSLKKAALDKPLEFRASVISFLPKVPEYSVQLILKSGGEQRVFPMTKRGMDFVVSAPPVKKSASPQVEIAARFESASIAGLVEDVVLKVGENPVRLSTIRQIESRPKAKPLVTLASGKVLEGEVSGLGMTELSLAGQKVKIDLSKATQVDVQPPNDFFTVAAIITVSLEGKELARSETNMIVGDLNITGGGAAKATITPPILEQEKVVKMLPDGFTEVVPGGGGRYLVFQLPKLKKLAIFDVNEARVTRYIPLAEDQVVYGASLEKVVVGLPAKGVLQRWSLESGELEASAVPDISEAIQWVMIGHASANLMVVNGAFYSIKTLKPVPIRDKDKKTQIWGSKARVLPSADGTVYGAWNTDYSPDTATTWVLEGNEIKRYDGSGLHHVAPGPDGQTVYTSNGFVSRTLNRGDAADALPGYCLPGTQGDYFVSLTSGGNSAYDGKPFVGGFMIHLRGIKAPIIRMEKADHGLSFDGWDRDKFGPWKRVFLVPDAKVIAFLPPSNDRVVLFKIDPDAALEQSGRDYLLVTSRPPTEVKAGTTFRYSILTKARNTPLNFSLDAAPKGMRVSTTGLIEWEVPKDASEETDEIILTIKDLKGNEVFHTFKLKVVK